MGRGGWGVGAGSASASSPGGSPSGPGSGEVAPHESPGPAARARSDLGAAERRPLPSAAQSGRGLRFLAAPSPLRPQRFATCRSADPDSTTLGGLLVQSSPGKGITPLVPLLEPPGGGGRGAAAHVPPTLLLGKVAPRRAAWPQGASELRVTIFFSLWSCLCAVVLPPPLPGLVHSLPMSGRPPSARRSSFPRHLLAWKRPRSSFSLSTSVTF